MFLHLCAILFTGGGRVGFPACITGHMTRGSTSRLVCIRGVCIGGGWGGRGVGQTLLPRHIGYYGIRSTSGRYASYWNAFLLHMFFLSLVFRLRGSIGTVLNFKDGNKEHGLKYVTCKQTFTFINFTSTTVSVFSF